MLGWWSSASTVMWILHDVSKKYTTQPPTIILTVKKKKQQQNIIDPWTDRPGVRAGWLNWSNSVICPIFRKENVGSLNSTGPFFLARNWSRGMSSWTTRLRLQELTRSMTNDRTQGLNSLSSRQVPVATATAVQRLIIGVDADSPG